jgi:hypothetical protein
VDALELEPGVILYFVFSFFDLLSDGPESDFNSVIEAGIVYLPIRSLRASRARFAFTVGT